MAAVGRDSQPYVSGALRKTTENMKEKQQRPSPYISFGFAHCQGQSKPPPANGNEYLKNIARAFARSRREPGWGPDGTSLSPLVATAAAAMEVVALADSRQRMQQRGKEKQSIASLSEFVRPERGVN